jgi:hypothetical protein
MGLTASPGAKKKEEETRSAIRSLMENSTCKIVKPVRYAAELRKYVNFPNISFEDAHFDSAEMSMIQDLSKHLTGAFPSQPKFIFAPARPLKPSLSFLLLMMIQIC